VAPASVATPAPPPPPPPPPAPTGVRLKTVTTQGAQVSENVTYMQGARQRVEFPGVVSIDQCDAKQVVMLNPTAKRYKTQAYPETPVQTTTAAPPPAPAAPAAPAAMPAMPTQAQMAGMDPAVLMQLQMAQMQAMQMQQQQQQGGGRGMGGMGMGMPQQKGGVVTITTTITDTLERQKMFGLEARHVKTIVVKQFSQTACDKTPYKLEMDAWYVELPDRKFDVIVEGSMSEHSPAAWANAGATWWLETLWEAVRDPDAVDCSMSRLRQGPPREVD